MRIKFSLGKACYSGETIDQNVTIYLQHCYSVSDVIETINHESLHAVMNKIAQSTSKKDHYIMKYLDIDQF